MSTDGWSTQVSWSAVRYVHDDDSMIELLDELYHGPLMGLYALYLGDPPTLYDTYATVELAKAGHAEEMAYRVEARELRRSKT